MLSFIMGIIQEFERNHGRRPQLVYMNPRHMAALMAEHPGVLEDVGGVALGFRIVVLPEAELPHPKAVWLPPRLPAERGARVSPRLLAFRHRLSAAARHTRERKK